MNVSRNTPGRVARADRAERGSPYARPETKPEAKVKRSSSMIKWRGRGVEGAHLRDVRNRRGGSSLGHGTWWRLSEAASTLIRTSQGTHSHSRIHADIQSFPGIRSLVSYITHPFARSPSSRGLPFSNLDIAVDKSESGSEDGWTGEPSQQGQDTDMFDLAAAGGREGEAFESRADKWRAKGEVAGGRRDTARRNLEVTAREAENPPIVSPKMPGYLPASLHTSPSMPSLGAATQPLLGFGSAPSIGNAVSTLTSSLKRRLSPTKATLPPRSPLPNFAPSTPAPQASASSSRNVPQSVSASSLALKAFLDAKAGQPLTPEDLRVIQSLTDNARQESEVGAGSVGNTAPEIGGWAAGSFTPRPIRPLPSTFTPARPAGSAFASPAPGFSMGLSPSKISTPGGRETPGSVRYIGPGWSARRMYPQKKSNLKPLFKFDHVEEGITKKRRIDEFQVGQEEDVPPVPPIPTSISVPNFASSSTSTSTFTKSPAKKLDKSPTKESPAKVDPVALGKRRAADIMLDLINSEIVSSSSKTPEAPPPFIVNPYHPDARSLVSGPSAPTPASASPVRNGTPRRSILKLSTSSQTPLRGAAKKLEEAKNAAPTPKKMTALEMLAANRPGSSSGKGKSVRVQTPEPETEAETEPDDLFGSVSGEEADATMDEGEREGADADVDADVEMTSSPKKSSSGSAKAQEEDPAPFQPFAAPQLSSSTLPLPSSSSPKPSSGFSFTPTAPATSTLKATAPKFQPSPLSRSVLPDEPKSSLVSSAPPSAPKSSATKDFSAAFLSAKNAALAVAKEALPFFTFHTTGLTAPSLGSERTQKAKAEAMKRDVVAFTFTLPSSAAADKPAFKPITSFGTPAGGQEWTCDTCMLKNPATALDQCTICEAPRPSSSKTTAAPRPSTSTPGSSASSAGPWTCDTCMLQNPSTATEQCGICEAPKPAKASAPSLFAFQPSAKATAIPGGEWTCGTCMLKNPAGALDKCTICEEPRP